MPTSVSRSSHSAANSPDRKAAKAKTSQDAQIEALSKKTLVEQPNTQSVRKFTAVMQSPNGHDKMRDFLKNVFKQMPDEKFLRGVDKILSQKDLDDQRVYTLITKEASQAKGSAFRHIPAAFNSLRQLQKDLSAQVEKLLGHDRIVHGYMEIGYPGRMVRPIASKLKFQGPKIVLNDSERLSDLVQSGFPRPYNKFVALEDYAPIDPSKVADASLDLVTCFIGLHHIPEEKIAPFLDSIQRVLRPGGSFVLMEHDANSEEMQRFVDVVHSVFNAATGVSQADEAKEVRNFQSLDYWSNRVEQSGLKRDLQEPLIREGDSTLNSLVRFTKPATNLRDIQTALGKTAGYKRQLLQTYLTAPEWFNVRVSQGYANFIKHTPFFQFPFFRHVKEFWGIFASSWNAARQHCGFFEVAFSEYTLMNLFIGITMTLEYCAKGLISFPVNLMYGGETYRENTEILHLLVDAKGCNLKELDERIIIKESFGEELTYIQIPRYFPCTEILSKFAREGVQCVDIAGQKLVQVDVTAPIAELHAKNTVNGCKKLYTLPSPENPDACIATLQIEVDKLHSALTELQNQGWSLELVHDY